MASRDTVTRIPFKSLLIRNTVMNNRKQRRTNMQGFNKLRSMNQASYRLECKTNNAPAWQQKLDLNIRPLVKVSQ
jgi:hypothetical protein